VSLIDSMGLTGATHLIDEERESKTWQVLLALRWVAHAMQRGCYAAIAPLLQLAPGVNDQ
jgi:type 1 glutamine amidotransferase